MKVQKQNKLSVRVHNMGRKRLVKTFVMTAFGLTATGLTGCAATRANRDGKPGPTSSSFKRSLIGDQVAANTAYRFKDGMDTMVSTPAIMGGLMGPGAGLLGLVLGPVVGLGKMIVGPFEGLAQDIHEASTGESPVRDPITPSISFTPTTPEKTKKDK